MTHHLTPEEIADAVEAPLPPQRHAHAQVCDTCRRQIDDARSVWREVSALEVPDPSPLFWDQMSARVRQQTLGIAAAGVPSVRRAWRLVWAAAGAAAIVVAFVVAMRPTAGLVDGGAAESPAQTHVVGEAEVPGLSSVEQAVMRLSPDDMQALVPLATEALLIDDLNQEERAVFVRLVEERMEELP